MVLAIPKINFNERMVFVVETVRSGHSHRILGTWGKSKSYKGVIGLLEWKWTRVDIYLLFAILNIRPRILLSKKNN